jgi:hypothetical protein
MSHENKNTNLAPAEDLRSYFPEVYPKHDDESGFVETFRESIANQFPDASLATAVEYNLDNLQSHSGVTRVALGVPYSTRGEHCDENGDLSLQATAMAGGLYALTSADVIPEATQVKGQGKKTLSILRKGSYEGEDVYFRERNVFIDDEAGDLHRSSVMIEIIPEETAQYIMDQPTTEQWTAFKEKVGYIPADVHLGNITKDTIDTVANQYADEAAAARALQDQLDAEKRDAPADTNRTQETRGKRKTRLGRFAGKLLGRDYS